MQGFVERFAVPFGLAPIVLPLLGFGAFRILRVTAWRDAPRRRAVIAQYRPDPAIDVFLAADLLGATRKAATAAIIDLAVRGNLRLLQRGIPGFTAGYGIQALQDGRLAPAEQTFLNLLLPPRAEPGATRWFAHGDNWLAARIAAWRRKTARRAVAEGYRRPSGSGGRFLLVALAGLAIIAEGLALIAFIDSLDRIDTDPFPLIAFLVGLVLVPVAVYLAARGFSVRPLTDRGREAVDHLEGIRLYTRVAEADRIRMLQSPSTAERVPLATASAAGGTAVSPVDPAVIVSVYERVLPYAILFGIEHEWLRELAPYYVTAPDWFASEGDYAFSVTMLSGAIAGFTIGTASEPSSSDSSSSSGGSDGGGSSGGGGGGGGGGGV